MKAIQFTGISLAAGLLTASWLYAGDKHGPPKMESKVVDSGSFGIYVNGKRIGTETFKIEQRPDFSIATAEIKVDDGAVKAEQTAEMQISPTGDLHSYVWRATVPAKEESSIEPKNQFLVQHVVAADLKKVDVPYLLTPSTVILDDNFFSQREILLWRYLAGCQIKDQVRECPARRFPVLVPQQHLSDSVTVTTLGPEKVSLNGAVRELTKVAIQAGDPDQMIGMSSGSKDQDPPWFIWVDPASFKVVKITVPSSNVEVTRD